MRLSIETIMAAVRGEHEAISAVLQEYDAYITKFATFHITDLNGRKRMVISEDVKQEIREKLILELPKIRGLKK